MLLEIETTTVLEPRAATHAITELYLSLAQQNQRALAPDFECSCTERDEMRCLGCRTAIAYYAGDTIPF